MKVRMKKLLSVVLAGAMMASITACGGGAATATTPAETTVEETTRKAPETLGETLLFDFEDRAAEKADATAQELAEGILTNEAILFQGGAMPVEEGFLMGFGEAEITGFEEAVMFAPMIGTIPFVGYVFDMPDVSLKELLFRKVSIKLRDAWMKYWLKEKPKERSSSRRKTVRLRLLITKVSTRRKISINTLIM